MTRLRFLAVAIALPCAATAMRAEPTYERDVQPFIASYCAQCHSSSKSRKKGGLDLTQFASATKAAEKREVWGKVAERLRAKEMPPADAKQPSDAERATLIAWSEAMANPTKNTDCKQLANDQNTHFYRGYVMSRRLTRLEYTNTIRDLTGVTLSQTEGMPADGGGGEGFDTNGDTLFLSALQIEQHLETSRRVMASAIASDGISGSLAIALPQGRRSARETANDIVGSFARRAFRRPVGAEEIERYIGLFDKAQARGDAFASSVRLALQGVLMSPHFLFLAEPQSDAEGIFPLPPFPLASRLSYFLWASCPDEELLTAAANGKLSTDDELRSQVRRMLADPKARALGDAFGLQWLNLSGFGTTTRPDPKRFPNVNDELLAAMREEVVQTVAGVFRDNRSVLELIDAESATINDRLATHYGVAGVTGGEFRRVALPDRERGGLVGTAAVLTATSYPLRTSPVLRGKWVLESLLGSRVPPPPPGAGELPKDDHQPDNLTFRKRLELHRSKPDCASCHARMDPLGFGLENFDAVGRWRTLENGLPVDAAGELPSGEKFASPAELKRVLLNRKAEFERNLARKLLGYALGRGLTKFENCVVDDSVKALEAGDHKSAALIETIVLSYPFRNRYWKH